MSEVIGADDVHRRLDIWQRAVERRLAEAVVTAGTQMQRDLVALAPVRDGDLRAALGSEDGLRITQKPRTGTRVEVGFLTATQKKRAFHGFWVEFGTKGYVKGQKRFSGRAKGTGRVKLRKMSRSVPPRPAYPYFRPAWLNLKRNLERLRAEAHARALADAVAGRRISDAVLGS
jgi:hypothetical protein